MICGLLVVNIYLFVGTGNFFSKLDTKQYIGIYWAFGLFLILSLLICGSIFAIYGTRAAKSLHEKASSRIVRAPMHFFDTTPLGRIINRFTKDQDGIDNILVDSIRMFLMTFTSTLFTFGLVIGTTWYFVFPLIHFFS